MTFPAGRCSVDLWRTWAQAVANPARDAALADLYARLDQAVQARGPVCWTSGRCCRFDSFGHRLYVTGLEIAWFLQQLQRQADSTPSTPAPQADPQRIGLPVLAPASQPPDSPLADACPYQVDRLCSVHSIRPLGCRIFFCQEGTQDWQQELYEQFLNELRAMHEKWKLPYRYIEWRSGLRDAQQARLIRESPA